jgi:hypothetical protein
MLQNLPGKRTAFQGLDIFKGSMKLPVEPKSNSEMTLTDPNTYHIIDHPLEYHFSQSPESFIFASKNFNEVFLSKKY